MITQLNAQYSEINKKTIAELAIIPDETLEFNISSQKSFTAAELWNIQRQKRTIVQRRSSLQ